MHCFKILASDAGPASLRDLITVRCSTYNLRGTTTLDIPKVITSHKLELSRNSDVHRYSTRCKDHLRLPSVKRNWGKQRTCYHAFKQWNALDSDLKNSDTICQFRSNFLNLFNLELTFVFLIFVICALTFILTI